MPLSSRYRTWPAIKFALLLGCMVVLFLSGAVYGLAARTNTRVELAGAMSVIGFLITARMFLKVVLAIHRYRGQRRGRVGTDAFERNGPQT